MQTLVYENYNKFISATDTIRRMKDDFNKMEDQMEVWSIIILGCVVQSHELGSGAVSEGFRGST